MSDRTFFIRLNLDDLAAETDALDSTEERGQWLEGFKVGSRGHALRDSWSGAKKHGYIFGFGCWQQAEAFREAQSAKGVASGIVRRERTKRQPRFNHGSTTVEPSLNQTSTKPEPNVNLSNNHKPITNNQEQQSSLRSLEKKSKTVPDSDLPPIPPVDAYTDEPPPSVQPPAPDPLDDDAFEDPPPSSKRSDKPMKTDARGIITTREIIDWI